MASRHIVIIGGGVIGLCVAYYALEKGHRVTIIERGKPDHDSCSVGNAGMIVPSHFIPLAAPGMVQMGLRMMANPESPFYVRPRFDKSLFDWGWKFVRAANAGHVTRSAPLLRDLSLASVRAYDELSDRFDNKLELVKRGLLMLCKTQKGLDEEGHLVKQAAELGIAAEVVTPQRATQLDPGARMEIAGAVYFPGDCHLSPHRLLSGLTEAITAGGGDWKFETEIKDWTVKNGAICSLQTNQGDIVADEYVVAAGSWSPLILEKLGVYLPMQAGKGYSVTLQKPRQKPEICSILTEARVAITPMGDTLRIGGTMEIAGRDESINPARVRGILRAVPQYYPEFGAEDFRQPDGSELPVWRGLRPCSPDGMPYIGRFARFTNLSAATGHAMMGVSLAPITGKLITALISGESPEIDIHSLRPDRYG